MSRSSDLFRGVLFGRKEKTKKKEKKKQFSQVKKERKTYISGDRIVFETTFSKTDFIKLIRGVSNYNGDINDEILERLNNYFIELMDFTQEEFGNIFYQFLEENSEYK